MYEEILYKLSNSKFRNSFHLNLKLKQYVNDKGINEIKEHAYYFINTRLKSSIIKNDGKQTPTKNHPVFISQHATATCCRSCLEKWHNIKKNKELTDKEVDYIVNLIITRIRKEMSNN